MDGWINHPHLPPGNLCGLDGRKGQDWCCLQIKKFYHCYYFCICQLNPGCSIGAINQLHLLRSHSLLQLGVDGDGDGHDDREWTSIGRHMVRALS